MKGELSIIHVTTKISTVLLGDNSLLGDLFSCKNLSY